MHEMRAAGAKIYWADKLPDARRIHDAIFKMMSIWPYFAIYRPPPLTSRLLRSIRAAQADFIYAGDYLSTQKALKAAEVRRPATRVPRATHDYIFLRYRARNANFTPLQHAFPLTTYTAARRLAIALRCLEERRDKPLSRTFLAIFPPIRAIRLSFLSTLLRNIWQRLMRLGAIKPRAATVLLGRQLFDVSGLLLA